MLLVESRFASHPPMKRIPIEVRELREESNDTWGHSL